MGTIIPLSDASRRPMHFPAVTALIILINVIVFVTELMRGDTFVLKWSVVPADIGPPECEQDSFQFSGEIAPKSHQILRICYGRRNANLRLCA